ncbi:LPP20 family lipoprotein [Thalassotalea agarivorans]|uniref:LPP20 lipoprotein n=1 Tax=Thalassotalea agarivorans TaxID=349064 RepID=A0A1H9Y5K9_THASX|nr:LPP20 family lipoprotein [Thalassotalea agarivorans]SES64168.1 LPP20 lipoprotein [Thalassotalea agarivorans]
MHLIKRLTWLVLAAMLVACQSTSAPDWVSNPEESFDTNKYLSAVGEGSNNEQASQRALANLSKIFSVSIVEKQIDSSTFSTRNQSTDVNVSRFISTNAQKELEGAKIAEYFRQENGSVFAVATLDKAQAATKFKQDIAVLDERVNEQLLYAANKAPNVFRALAAIEKAYLSQQARDNINRDLILVADKGMPAQHSVNSIETLYRNKLAGLAVQVDANSPELQSQVSAAVSQLGAAVVAESPLVITANFDNQPVLQEQGWYWLRGSLNLTATEDGVSTSKNRYDVKVSAQQESMLDKRLKDKMSESMMDYLLALVRASD